MACAKFCYCAEQIKTQYPWFMFDNLLLDYLRLAFQFVQVEIVMGLEEEFGITVEEESAQTITTVQDAADMIDKLLETKA